MIYGIGTDLIEIRRVLKACESESFITRVYTDRERREASEHRRRLSGDFAVKEAVAKALGTGFVSFRPIDIEVLRDGKGKPFVTLYDGAKRLSDELGITSIHVSISDTDELVVAYAIAECGG